MLITLNSASWSHVIKLLLFVTGKEEGDGTMSDSKERKGAYPWVFQWKYPKSKANHTNSNSDVNKIDIL